MIVDRIENLGLYYPVLKGLEEASEFVKKFYKEPSEDGRYDIDGDHIYASVATYETKSREGAQFESHKKYVDLQAVIDGTEIISWAPVEGLKVESESFSQGGDIAFYSGDTVMDARLPAGYFALLFPDDAHMPCIMDKESSKVTKIVVKIEL
ncbi:MAG: YhcH/YjgK/YiaL family protein [Clostridia bacterium]|nr:YhcH/YjgK/YiaL family protein [Clostridia bacterium]